MTEVLSVRVSEEERALLEAASQLARTSLSDFIRRKALDAAADIYSFILYNLGVTPHIHSQ